MFKLGPPKQIAYAVPDAFEAAKRWVKDFGAGPFFVSEHIPVTDVIYRGSRSSFDHTSAYGQWGDIMVELVQDHLKRDLLPQAMEVLRAPAGNPSWTCPTRKV